jgi:hypothetical protein
MAYVSSFGAMGGEDFAASAQVVRNIGGLAGNLLGGAAYLQSGGQVGEQQYAASLVYAGAARQGVEGLWDASHGAWGRGEYMQSSASVGGLLGLPIPLDEAVQVARVVNALEDVVDAARVAESVANGASRLSFGELRALKTAGLSHAEIARQIELNGDIHLFRGTSEGWGGHPVPKQRQFRLLWIHMWLQCLPWKRGRKADKPFFNLAVGRK